MMAWKPDFAVVSDISANIFAVFVLILLMMLASGRSVEQGGAPPATIEATTDLVTVERAPLRAGEIIDLLHDRAGSGWTIDLFDARIEVGALGNSLPVVLDVQRDGAASIFDRLDQILRSGNQGAPVRLYVFSNRLYAQAIAALTRNGSPWREMSVPVALRRQTGSVAGDAWSDAFLELSRRQFDKDRFRQALARLLAGGAGGGKEGGARGGEPGGLTLPPPFEFNKPWESLLDRFMQALKLLVSVVSVMLAICAVAAIEWRSARRKVSPFAKLQK